MTELLYIFFCRFEINRAGLFLLFGLGYEQVTYRFFHWKKGTPFAEDQGDYGKLTWWEQVDDGRQLTRNRKFLTVVPVVLCVAILSPTFVRCLYLLWLSLSLVQFLMCCIVMIASELLNDSLHFSEYTYTFHVWRAHYYVSLMQVGDILEICGPY